MLEDSRITMDDQESSEAEINSTVYLTPKQKRENPKHVISQSKSSSQQQQSTSKRTEKHTLNTQTSQKTLTIIRNKVILEDGSNMSDNMNMSIEDFFLEYDRLHSCKTRGHAEKLRSCKCQINKKIKKDRHIKTKIEKTIQYLESQPKERRAK